MTRLLMDIGGTNTRMCLRGDLDRDPMRDIIRIGTHYKYEDMLNEFRAFKRTVRHTIDAVCVAFGVGLENGRIVGAGKMPDFVGRSIVADIQMVFDCPAFVAHDCICGLLSVVKANAITECIGYVTISSGVGAAVAFQTNGVDVFQRVRIGHHVISFDGELCKCGRKGCLSAYIDSKTLEKRFGQELICIEDQAFWKQYATRTAVGLVNLCKLFGLRQLYLGGGVTSNPCFRELLPDLFAHSYGMEDDYGRCNLHWLEYNDEAPLNGSYFLAERANLVLKG